MLTNLSLKTFASATQFHACLAYCLNSVLNMKAFNHDCEIFANLRIAFVSSSNHHRSPQEHSLYVYFAADEDREEGAGQDSVRGPDEAHLLRPVRGGGGEPQHCL